MNARALYWKTLEKSRDISDQINNKLKPFYCPLQQKHNRGIYAVEINAKIGFFAQLNWCLCIFAHCERFDLRPAILLSSPFYVRIKGESWLDYFFDSLALTEVDRKLLGSGSIQYSRISDIGQMGLPFDYYSQMTLESANRLLGNQLSIKPEILDYVESFVDEHFGHKAVLGIHYRGTDKKSEAPSVPWEYVAKTIANYLEANPQVGTLFVASDDGDFIEWIRSRFDQIDVVVHQDQEKSRDGRAIHIRPDFGDNYIKGKEALVNCLLLSKCAALIRTASFLSAWSSVFNPELPVVMLNRPFDDKCWFPDAVIAARSLDAYLPDSP